ncbi:peptide ABC transporter substrate-binding protein, partial [Serratia sp. EWG9]|nr:peptide ABC transporter substrate-binding protein [Serratia sp. EWG9]
TPPTRRALPFHPRCPLATAQCREQAPQLRSVAPGHQVACHLVC